MKDRAVQFVCTECGRIETKWLGRCPDCGSWNSFEEEIAAPPLPKAGKSVVINTNESPVFLKDIAIDPGFRFETGISELDRVLGGGVMRGSSILLGGEPGIGKSTLMLQMIEKCSFGRTVLYVSGEESPSQVKLRAERLGLSLSNIAIFCDTRIEILATILEKTKPDVVVVDSLQTLSSNEVSSPAGSVNQIRCCSTELVGLSKRLGISLFLIGHVTKEGLLAGPKVIEHLVDTVLYFDQAGSGVRLIRAAKNRFGSIDEIGIFHMSEKGLLAVTNPTSFFITDREGQSTPPGIVYTAVIEGTRTFLVEIQALTVPAKSGFSRVYSDRIDNARVTRIAAVLERHAGIRLNDQDIYVNVAGGMKLNEVSIELPLALALWSALMGVSLPSKLISFGELSLSGEVRNVGFSEKREKAAAELGFSKVLVPKTTKLNGTLAICRCESVKEALFVCGKMV
ncbi:DNA repair protein RadA [Sphaerochaeta pleomorpha str. Grapes]|uniref:DNA repair protein RadA n=1 Tax=Sphaerochaeta pleomorpha (strain ATCC BAA-1885 / DSM 22778 / Grapes) TaxID=158190 RepID=G8QYU5_SPHPG|nr:DNA repair protein RadA [Sphaerochaeta pleomorpha]AEV29722.1 DNA repair protein RadA [Sphaerochaeta pleomorpha str. Grapes]